MRTLLFVGVYVGPVLRNSHFEKLSDPSNFTTTPNLKLLLPAWGVVQGVLGPYFNTHLTGLCETLSTNRQRDGLHWGV